MIFPQFYRTIWLRFSPIQIASINLQFNVIRKFLKIYGDFQSAGLRNKNKKINGFERFEIMKFKILN